MNSGNDIRGYINVGTRVYLNMHAYPPGGKHYTGVLFDLFGYVNGIHWEISSPDLHPRH